MLQSFREGIGRWLAIFILALIALTFVFWGVDLSFYGSNYAARVNGEEISILDYERDFQSQLNDYQQFFLQEITEEIQRELRSSSLEGLIRKEALSQKVNDEGYIVSNSKLIGSIRSMPIFQVDGDFSIDIYRSQLLNSGLSSGEFEALQLEQLLLVELQSSIIGSGFNTLDEFRRYIQLNNQTREVSYLKFDIDDYVDDPMISDIAIEEYYLANQDQFLTEESVDIEYLEIKKDELSFDLTISDEDLRSFYEDERYRFISEEDRSASHILLERDSDNNLSIYETIVSRLESGEAFEDLVEEFSIDTGTVGSGGNLGWIARGSLDENFENELFSMQLGEVSGLVRTDFGEHIIKLDEIRSGDIQEFETVKDQLFIEYQENQKESLFYDLAIELADLSFNAYDTLASVSDSMDIPLKNFFSLTKSGSSTPFISSPEVATTAFSDEILSQGLNSSPIELNDGHVVVLRTTQFNEPTQRMLEDVKLEIQDKIILEEAKALAELDANKFFESLDIENDNYASIASNYRGEWRDSFWVDRESEELPSVVVESLFTLPYSNDRSISKKLVILEDGDVYVVLLSGLRYGETLAIPADERNQMNAQLAEQSSLLEFEGYIDLVRADSEVFIPEYVTNPSF
tara:strand:+ start:520 stop:2415 length:1896 start_codon:yes stop_codon:yes gene_type:complete